MSNKEHVGIKLKGHIRIFEQDNPENLLFEDHNVICLNTQFLFARLMVNPGDPAAGVWGLCVGAGDSSWPPQTQPDALATQQSIVNELRRKQCQPARFVDSNLNVIPNGGYSNMVDFQTVLNSVNDNINTPIRELGLIGGGKTGGLDLGLKATPFFNSSSQDNINKTDTALLINYKTLPPLVLPAGINFIFSWVLTF